MMNVWKQIWKESTLVKCLIPGANYVIISIKNIIWLIDWLLHRWKTIQLSLGRLWQKVCPVWRTFPTPPNTHWREEICLHHLRSPLHAQWPPDQACSPSHDLQESGGHGKFSHVSDSGGVMVQQQCWRQQRRTAKKWMRGPCTSCGRARTCRKMIYQEGWDLNHPSTNHNQLLGVLLQLHPTGPVSEKPTGRFGLCLQKKLCEAAVPQEVKTVTVGQGQIMILISQVKHSKPQLIKPFYSLGGGEGHYRVQQRPCRQKLSLHSP